MAEQEERSSTAPAIGSVSREIYFPTYIYFSDLPDAAELNTQMRSYIYAWREEDREGLVRSNIKQTGTWHSQDDLQRREEARELCDRILAVAGEIFRDMGYHPSTTPLIDNMWANIQPRHGYNRNHVHPRSLWSGVYYVQVPQNAGRIFFSDPRPQIPMWPVSYDPDKARGPESWQEVYYQPIEGRIILFPSWLVHEVEPNMSEQSEMAGDRISISFNLLQRWIETSQ